MDKDEQLNVRRQCEPLKICRSVIYYLPKGEPEDNLRLMREIDELHLEDPSAGTRRMRSYLERQGFGKIARSRVSRIGIDAIYPRKRTTIPGTRSGIYPYLLRGMEISRPNQVWCADITYIPMAKGFMYLFAVMDWYSRKVLAWGSIRTFCLRTLNKAVAATGAVPEIFNTDQGCQFSSADWSGMLRRWE